MSETLIARRYALALFKLAGDTGKVAEISSDMAGIESSCKSSPDLAQTLKNPVMKKSDKQAIINNIFAGKVSATTLKFLNFLIEKKRISLLQEVSVLFLRMEEEARGVAEARIITVKPAESDVKETLVAGLSKKYNKEFSVKYEENPDIMGGFLLYIKDKVYDFSIRNQIKLLREQLLGTR